MIEKILEEFENEFYKRDDALFDRQGNNISFQVENFLKSSLEKIQKETELKIGEQLLNALGLVITDLPAFAPKDLDVIDLIVSIGVAKKVKQERKSIVLKGERQRIIETIRDEERERIIKKLEEEDDWMEMHKCESKLESARRVGFGKAIDLIKKIRKLN